jgi:hypothetical protein
MVTGFVGVSVSVAAQAALHPYSGPLGTGVKAAPANDAAKSRFYQKCVPFLHVSFDNSR